MRIVSSFCDYYDTAAAYGIDKDCVYVRNYEFIAGFPDPKDDLAKVLKHREYAGQSGMCRRFLLGFCGELHPCIKIKWDQVETTAYSWESFVERAPKEIHRNMKLWKSKYYGRMTEDEFWNPATWSKYRELFHKYKTPIFLLDSLGLEINPNLSALNFYHIKTPPEAFQDVFMFVSGVLANRENEMIEIDDKIMLHKKGFDKHSFKTPPGGKKRRKNK